MKKIEIIAKESDKLLFNDIRALIEQARGGVAQAINSGLVVLYWSIGSRIRREILKGKRAGYGEEIIQVLSGKISAVYGSGFSRPNIFRMVRFAEVFPKGEIVSTLSRQLGWSHFAEIIQLKDPLKRDFYAEMCRIERWSVRTLHKKIGGMLFERTALSKKPVKLAELELRKLKEEDTLTPDLVFRDPYFLDFLGLKGAYQEKDIEAAILREMEAFILELGAGFTFVARQKRMQVGPDDFYLDLLFFHRKLRRLVAIELKFDKFKPEFKGQMELYLRWLNKYERQPHEESPIGLILCAGKSEEQVELLELDKSGIKVAEYLTELPSRSALETRLHQAIAHARERLIAKEQTGEGK
ncbi:MAG: PDDEXK nuclease domain-containing protein [Elusimicrobiota bacterium]|nr:PDDEXK nuclease domain-containing protein [Elusimicrobiota bacterium]